MQISSELGVAVWTTNRIDIFLKAQLKSGIASMLRLLRSTNVRIMFKGSRCPLPKALRGRCNSQR